MSWRFFLALTVAFILSTCDEGQSSETNLPNVKQITVVVCDGLTLQDLASMGEPITTMLQKGAVGLLSGSSLELSGRKGVLVTLGSGRRAKAFEEAELGEWLLQSGKFFRLEGDGALEAILGVKPSQVPTSLQRFNVVFVALAKLSLAQRLKSLMKRLDEDSCLWLVVPNSPQTSWSTRRLTPILVFGKRVPSGLLTSPTTRRLGLVSSVDFAPTLLAQLGVGKPETVTGSIMKVVRFEGDKVAYLAWLDERSVRPLRDLPSLAVAMSAITVSALALVLLALLSANLPNQLLLNRHKRTIKSIAEFFVIVGMSIPTSLFLVTHLPHETGAVNSVQLLFLTFAFAALSLKLASWLDKVLPDHLPVSLRAAGLICAFTAAIALLGVPLYWATPLGHYPTTGWRYFGITNSGIGLVLAGTIFAWKLLSLPKRLLVIWLASSPFLMGFSLWGANFGGALTLAIGFATSWVCLTGKNFSWRKVGVTSLIAVVLTMMALSIAESFLPSDQKAHWGLLLERMELLGLNAFVDIVKRKLLLLWEFFGRTPLNFVAFAIFVAFHFAVAVLSRHVALFTELRSTFVSTFFGCWAGLLLNDSGMEVVGMAMVIFGGVFLLALLEGLTFAYRGDEVAVRASS